MGTTQMHFTVNVANDGPIEVSVGDATFTAHSIELNLVPKDDRHLIEPLASVRPEDLVEEWELTLKVRPDDAGWIRAVKMI